MSHSRPVIVYILSKQVYESNKWDSMRITARDPRVRVVYFIIDRYHDNTPYIVMKGKLYKDDQVVLVSAIDDLYVSMMLTNEVCSRVSLPIGLHLFVPHLRSDKESSHRRKRGYMKSIEYLPEEEEETDYPEEETVDENEDDEEIYTAHHSVNVLSNPTSMRTYFLEPHSMIVVTTKSRPYEMMIVFMQFVLESLMKSIPNLRNCAVVFNFPDTGAKHRYKDPIESLIEKMKFPNSYIIAVDKVRTGINNNSVTKSTLLVDPEQLSEIQGFEKTVVITLDDLTQSGGTLIDSAFLTRDKILGANEGSSRKVLSVLSPFHFHPIRDPETRRFKAADRLNELIDGGDIHAIYTTDSIPEVICDLDESSKIQVIPIVSTSILGIVNREYFVGHNY